MPPPTPATRPAGRTIELLAPAGGLEAGLAAFQYGADAVYLGLQKYSARADAQNFTLDELDRFLGHARTLAPVRKAFVAVNTLVLDGELDGLVSTLGDLSDLGADAIIVQDLGVARLARRHFPELELHASTQLAAHSAAAVETLRDLGFARVTLARELTLEEIRACAAVPGVEVEAFLHGALCYAYSGLCLFSSHVVGRSGNRGSCAYPCRDRWEITALDGAPLDPAHRSGFAFSMKDLALPDHVGALREAGVASLKIEGRKKAPTYVAATVDFYRRLLDGKLAPGERLEAEADLQTTFARPWTSLYLDDHQEKDVADRDVVGHRGAPVGKVEAVVKPGGIAAVRFRTWRTLMKHDGLQIEIPGLDRPFGFGVTTLRVVARGAAAEAYQAPAGSLVEVPLPDDYPTIPLGAPVSCSNSQEVKLRYRVEMPNLGTRRARRPVQVEVEVGAEGLRLSATTAIASTGPTPRCQASSALAAAPRAVRAEASLPGPFEPARDAAKMAASGRAAFEKLGDTRFALEAFAWQDPVGRFVPVSRLNEARRALVEALDAAVTADVRARVEAALVEVAEVAPGPASASDTSTAVVPAGPGPASDPAAEGATFTVKVDRLETLDAFAPEDFAGAGDVVVDLGLLPLRGLADQLGALAERAGPERLRLGLPLIVRAWDERALRARIEALLAAGFRRWELTGPASWSLLGLRPPDAGAPGASSPGGQGGAIGLGGTGIVVPGGAMATVVPGAAGLDLTSDWSLYAVNRVAARQLADMGVRRVTLSTEDIRPNLAALLGRLGPAASVVLYEDSPLFISESCPYANLAGGCPGPADCTFEQMELTSSHGGKVQVVNERCRSFTLGDAPYNLSPRLAALRAAGVRSLRVHFVHRRYAPEEAAGIWRALRRGEVVSPGHTGSFDRGEW